MAKFFKINEKPYFGVIFYHILLLLPKGDFFEKIRLIKIAVVPQYLNVKDTW